MNKKYKKRKLNFKRIILSILFCLLFIIIMQNFSKIKDFFKNENILASNNSSYDIIKLDDNPNYAGIGQERIDNKDGYFTTFTTISDHQKTYIEYKQNGSSSWCNMPYWENTMESDGCGITALSIILSGYKKNYSPEDLRKRYYPFLNYDNLSNELSNVYGIKNSDFYYDSVHLSEKNIVNHLNSNRPVLICVWNNPSENRWTTSSHYMVLLAADNMGKVYVSNPNGLDNSSKSSGWYDTKEVFPYIAKALYVEDY